MEDNRGQKWLRFKEYYLSTSNINLMKIEGTTVMMTFIDGSNKAELSVQCRTIQLANYLLFDYIEFITDAIDYSEGYNDRENTMRHIFEITELKYPSPTYTLMIG